MVKRKANGNNNGSEKKANNRKYSKYSKDSNNVSGPEKQLNGCVKKVTVLNKKNSDEAMKILQRCIKCTLKVIEKRSWKISSLNEFYPKENNLLGLNINRSKIMIRMRPPDNDNTFYNFQDILGTWLHELTHMAISPHNAEFDALLNTLWDEIEAEPGYADLLYGSGSGNIFGLYPSTSGGKSTQLTSYDMGTGNKLGGKLIDRNQTALQKKMNIANAAAARHNRQINDVNCGHRNADGSYKLGSSSGSVEPIELTPSQLRTRMANAAESRRRRSLLLSSNGACPSAQQAITDSTTSASTNDKEDPVRSLHEIYDVEDDDAITYVYSGSDTSGHTRNGDNSDPHIGMNTQSSHSHGDVEADIEIALWNSIQDSVLRSTIHDTTQDTQIVPQNTRNNAVVVNLVKSPIHSGEALAQPGETEADDIVCVTANCIGGGIFTDNNGSTSSYHAQSARFRPTNCACCTIPVTNEFIHCGECTTDASGAASPVSTPNLEEKKGKEQNPIPRHTPWKCPVCTYINPPPPVKLPYQSSGMLYDKISDMIPIVCEVCMFVL